MVEAGFATPTRTWFDAAFAAGPTRAQARAWPAIRSGTSTLLLAPTGSGKTLAAFMVALDRLMFGPAPEQPGVRVLYVSPLKALGVDVERNLRAPLAGIRATADRLGHPVRVPSIGVRSGDTPAAERQRMVRKPPEILITTPESLYLLLTSNARVSLETVETVIVDEIHAMVPTKRGAHLFLGLERLEHLRAARHLPPLQRIGLSATQRPLDEIARLLGGGLAQGEGWAPRPVDIVDAGKKKPLDLTIEVPVEDMARLGTLESEDSAPGFDPEPPTSTFTRGYEGGSEDASEAEVPAETSLGGEEEDWPFPVPEEEIPSGPAAQPESRSIWPSIHPRLVELIRAHRSTLLFVNSRRLAERLAAAINEVAAEELCLAHHGSLSKDARAHIEDRLKRGQLPALVATSSLELGIDMGAIDLVVQIEAPPSVASGMQRIGRASHEVGGVSKGIVFPKYRGDLLAAAAVAARMLEGTVEETFHPRNPLDVLAQHLVAAIAMDDFEEEELYALVRGAAPFAQLPREAFVGVLDMLSGKYPSEELSDLRPRIVWDRVTGKLSARAGAKRVAVINGGTIPDRGLYGVFLADGGEGASSRRVGELDEEMVFESRVGDVFLLGASSWRIEDITHDRVLVTPAPGEPGKMPFWHGDRPGRPAELGRAIGALCRELSDAEPEAAAERLVERHRLDPQAATNLVRYLSDQREAAPLPTDRKIVIERFTDEIGDWRVVVLTPFGARVHAPWATAVSARAQAATGVEVDLMWNDDGMVFRFLEAESPPDPELFLPLADEIEDQLVAELGRTSLFASHFRENAGRALLLPKRSPGKRTPLWALRRRSSGLLQVASRFPSFPIILETYRECLEDVFDLPSLKDILREITARKIRVEIADTKTPSPFSASVMFSYVASFMYEGDAPLAERRAQALTIDHAQLRALLGEEELRKLLDAEVIDAVEAQLQNLDGQYPAKHPDALHDLLRRLGPLTLEGLAERSLADAPVRDWVEALVAARRIFPCRVADAACFAAAEDAAKLRDGLGVNVPPGLPGAFLDPSDQPIEDLVLRFARTHGPFPPERCALRFGLGTAAVRGALERLEGRGLIQRGRMLPRGRGEEFCDAEVLRRLKRMSLARLRAEVEPVETKVLARFAEAWHGLERPPSGLDALLAVIEQLQGAALPASDLDEAILPARNAGFRPSDLDELCAAGEIVWQGVDPIGTKDGRVAIYLVDAYPRLAHPVTEAEGDLCARIREHLGARGALFFSDLVQLTGGFAPDLAEALWSMVWAGEVTNDTLRPLRSRLAGPRRADRARASRGRSFRSRRAAGPPGTEGRWSLLPKPAASETERRTALAHQLLERHGVLTREAAGSEIATGGFSLVYPILKAMESAGKIRRGYFVEGLGAAQFALGGAEDRLRACRELDPDAEPEARVLAATDPANPYGAALSWPEAEHGRPQRSAGSRVVLFEGELLGFVHRGEHSLLSFLPQSEPVRERAARALAQALAAGSEERRQVRIIGKIDGVEPREHPLTPYFEEAGFRRTGKGLMFGASTASRPRGGR